jgi:hypothetical protein
LSQEEKESQAAAQKEAQLSAPARAEVEKILQATIRQYETIRQIHGQPPFTFEERQAALQQLKRSVYGKGAAQKDENQQVNERFLQFLASEGLDPDVINTYARALQELQEWYGKPLPPNPADIFPQYVQHLRETGQSEYKIENVRAMLKKLIQFEGGESNDKTDE